MQSEVDAAVAGAETDVSDLGMIHIIFSWVKSSGVKSAGVNQKRRNCAAISRTTEIPWGKSLRVKWVGIKRLGQNPKSKI
jgi:hypothetical protein